MLCLWMQMRDSCDPGRVSDGSRLAVYKTLSIAWPSSIFFLVCALCCCSFLFVVFVFVFMLSLELCRLDVPLIFSCPTDHVPDWQPHYTTIL